MPYVRYLDSFVSVLKAGVKIGNAIDANKAMITHQDLNNLRRVYIIDENGYQIGTNIDILTSKSANFKKLSPLVNTSNSNWYYRPYFRNAISSPNTIHCSDPYLSVTDAAMCLTLSVAVMVDGKRIVVCCDIDWSNPVSSRTSINFAPKALLS